MNLGTENKNKTRAAIILGALALASIVYRFVSMNTSSSTTAASGVVTDSAPAPLLAQASRSNVEVTNSPGAQRPARLPSLDPTLQLRLLHSSEDIKYTGAGRNIFRAQVDIPKPIAPVVPTPQPVVPQGPPPPPPINLKFFGFANKPGEAKRIFLSQGDDVFIAQEGDIVDRRYRVVRISPTSVEVEDVLNNHRQSIPLTPG